MPKTKELTEKANELHEKANEITELIKLMAHPDRMVVLCLLSSGEMNVSELRRYTKLSQSAFSQHLAVLRNNKIVAIRKSSQQVFYSIADERVTKLISALHQSFCANND